MNSADPPSSEVTRPVDDTEAAKASPRLKVCWFTPERVDTPLRHGEVWGRESNCQVVLSGDEISRRHAQVVAGGLLPLLRDLESRNGIFVNTQRVRERSVGPGDVLRLGAWCGLVCVSTGGEATFGEIAPGWHGGEALRKATANARTAARTDLPIIIEGATGTGKEGLAQAIHSWSGRSGRFVAIDCGALTEQLAEGELFGYRKGAFTGAQRDHQGHLRAAAGGTLFLDEVVNLPLVLQAKLLRALQQREVMPLGTSEPVAVDVRVVAAAQAPLREAVAAGRFRADLLARLEGVTVALPALRARREDVVPLFRHFIGQTLGSHGAPRLDPKFVETLLRYDWPLNVRELSLLAQRLAALAGEASSWKRGLLPEHMLRAADAEQAIDFSEPSERRATNDPDDTEALAQSLRLHGGNVSAAAAALGMSRSRANRILAARPELKPGRPRGDVT